MRVLHSVQSLRRSQGGLPVAAVALAEGLTSLGHEAAILSSAAGQNEWVLPPEPVEIFPVSAGDSLLHRAFNSKPYLQTLTDAHSVRPFDLVHQHGLWTAGGRAVAKFSREQRIPLVVSPHGMLEPWALGHHRGRKRLAWWLYQRGQLHRANALLATSEMEAAQLRKLGLTQPTGVLPHILPPIPPAPLDPAAVAAPKEKRIALFLSRVHPKKGIPLLLDAWSRLRPKGWELHLAGPGPPSYFNQLKAGLNHQDLEETIHFLGPLHGAAKDTALRRADLFILPTYSENFGIVIAEALQYGLPAITTTGTPWQCLEKEDCGWWVAPTGEEIRQALDAAVCLEPNELQAMGQRGQALIAREFDGNAIAKRLLSFYEYVLGRGEKPADVRE